MAVSNNFKIAVDSMWYSHAMNQNNKLKLNPTPRLAAFCHNVNLELCSSNTFEILGWNIEKFMAVLLQGKGNRNLDYLELCKRMSIVFVEKTREDAYYRVGDLVADVAVEEFRDDLVSYGLTKKQFLNEVFGILRDISTFLENTILKFNIIETSPKKFNESKPRQLSPLSRRAVSLRPCINRSNSMEFPKSVRFSDVSVISV